MTTIGKSVERKKNEREKRFYTVSFYFLSLLSTLYIPTTDVIDRKLKKKDVNDRKQGVSFIVFHSERVHRCV
jgi:hypothetical protein